MGGPVDDDMANLIVAQLLYLDSASKKDIIMYVNSPGGSVTAGQHNSSQCQQRRNPFQELVYWMSNSRRLCRAAD